MLAKLKKELAIAILSAAVLAVVIPIAVFVTNNQGKLEQTQLSAVDQQAEDFTALDQVSPVDLPRTGIPFLVAYELAGKPLAYHTVDASDNSWILKVVSRGETNISEQELKRYFAVIADKNMKFEIGLPGGISKYYSIEFTEVPISLEVHNIKAYRMYVEPEKYINIDLSKNPWLEPILQEEFTWIPVDDVASSINILTANQNFNFKVIHEDGHSEFYNIRYAGPGLDKSIGV